MLRLIKKIVVLVLMTCCSSCSIIKNITGNFMLIPKDFLNKPDCFLLKNEECKVRKVSVDNDCMTFPYNIGVDRCIGSCNDKNNPYFKVCLPDIVKNISIKSFDLISQKNVLRNISFYQSCKCGCLLDKNVCNNKQKWNKEKCRCECLVKEKCDNDSFFNVVNCSCELRKSAKLVVESKRFPEECKEISDDIKKNHCIMENKTVTLIKKIECKAFPENCKPFCYFIYFICLCFRNNNRNNDLFLQKIKK